MFFPVIHSFLNRYQHFTIRPSDCFTTGPKIRCTVDTVNYPMSVHNLSPYTCNKIHDFFIFLRKGFDFLRKG